LDQTLLQPEVATE
jgi:deoxyribose-phosphate aldolase